ncbi:hypothetical protein JNM05_10370 [bacterium]|nr:hypothetical protein [bacterium]
MKKFGLLILIILCNANLLAQEGYTVVLSGGLVRPNDSKSKKFWNQGKSFDLRTKFKRTDFGAMFAEIGYLRNQLKSKNRINGRSTHRSDFLVGIGTEINSKLLIFNLNSYFSVGALHEKKPAFYKFERGGPYLEKKSTNTKYYFNSCIGLSRPVSKNVEIGINTRFLFSIRGEPRGFWFPTTLDLRIHF